MDLEDDINPREGIATLKGMGGRRAELGGLLEELLDLGEARYEAQETGAPIPIEANPRRFQRLMDALRTKGTAHLGRAANDNA